MLKLKISFLLICLSVIFYSCKKEYSLEAKPQSTTAVFTLTGSPAVCTNAVIGGTYNTGVALDATNTVTIAINVTAIGSYTISTGIINGVSFAATGSFTKTGPQVVILSGTGIPLSTGSFDYIPGTNGCTFSIAVTGGGGGGSGTSVFAFTGAPGTCTNATTTATFTSGITLVLSDIVTIDVNVTTAGTWSVTTPVINGIYFSGTGNFTTTGPQTIALAGGGTPVAAGDFDYTPSNNGCSFTITVIAGQVVTDFLKCTIDGVARTFNENLSGALIDPTTIAIGGDENAATPTSQFIITLTKSPLITTGTYNKFNLLINPNIYCVAAYQDAIVPDPWAIGLLPASAGFTVTVTAYTTNPNRIEGTFSGTIYSDTGLGTITKVITAGEFGVTY